MTEKIVCPGCYSQFRNKPELAGKRIRCPKCNGPIVVAAAASAIEDHWGTDSGMFDPASLAPTATASYQPADIDRPTPPPLPLPYQSPPAVAPWNGRQLQCRRVGMRLGIFGAIGLVLPFAGVQFAVLSLLGGYAQLIALALMLGGSCLFAGAYLSRTQWCGGHFAALKIGGVLAAGVVVVLVFLFGALVLGLLSTRATKANAKVAAVAAPAPAATMPSAAASGSPNATNAPQTAVGTMPHTPPKRPMDAPQAAFANLQQQLWPSRESLGKGAGDLTLIIRGLDALGGEHKWRMKQLISRIEKLQGKHGARGWSASGGSDDRLVRVVVRPVDDVPAAARMIDFGAATVGVNQPRLVNVSIDASKFTPSPADAATPAGK